MQISQIYTYSQSNDTVQLRQALSTLPLEGEAWLAARLELRLGPPELRNYPPSPYTLRHTRVLRGGLDIDWSKPLLLLLLISIIAISLWSTTLPTRGNQLQLPPSPSTDSSGIGDSPYPLGPVQTAMPVLESSPSSSPEQVLTATPTLLESTATATHVLPAMVPTQVPTIYIPTPIPVYAPPIDRQEVIPTVEPVEPTEAPTATITNTPYWGNLIGSPTPIRMNITPTSGTGTAGNDFCTICFERSGTITGP